MTYRVILAELMEAARYNRSLFILHFTRSIENRSRMKTSLTLTVALTAIIPASVDSFPVSLWLALSTVVLTSPCGP
jgi:hypothetical protein